MFKSYINMFSIRKDYFFLQFADRFAFSFYRPFTAFNSPENKKTIIIGFSFHHSINAVKLNFHAIQRLFGFRVQNHS